MDGIINLFKPRGMTSHDGVSLIRRALGMKRVGHTGTLDPNASGVLPICIGKATRISEYLMELDKEYICQLNLGLRTDSLDMDGKVISHSSKRVTREKIEEVMDNYRGTINQIPPMYSALKVNGKKLYELAREGQTIERKSRQVNIYELDILEVFNNENITFRTKCSKGTYIRSLCDDIGFDLGTFGYMSYLIRTNVGNFNLSDSYSIEYIRSLRPEELKSIIIPMDTALSHFKEIIVEDSLYSKITNGMMVEINKPNNYEINQAHRVYCRGSFIGIGYIIEKDHRLFVKMHKVLI